MKPAGLGEMGFLRAMGLFDRPVRRGWVGPGDDAAVMPPSETSIVFSADILAEGVHFRISTSTPEDVGYKSLAVNVSDIAAMGAKPVAATVSLVVPETPDVEWFKRFYDGLALAEHAYGCPVVGGDLSTGVQLVVSVSILGECGRRGPVLRSGAEPGEGLYLTGETGLSAAGLKFLENPGLTALAVPELLKRHLRPEPRLAFAREASRRGHISAMVDVSDGVAIDAGHLAEQSGVGIEIDSRLVPVAEVLARGADVLGVDPLLLALSGGEDYELLFTAAAASEDELFTAAGKTGVKLTKIGCVKSGEGITFLGPDGEPWVPPVRGYDHFRGP